MPTGIGLITEERAKANSEEGIEYNYNYGNDSLACAAACYAMPREHRLYSLWMPPEVFIPNSWPFKSNRWQPSEDDRVKELVKAGAMIAAEIDRLQMEKEPPKTEVKHTEITTEKITPQVWVAKCHTLKPIKAEVTMRGISEQDAIDKLKKFFDEQ